MSAAAAPTLAGPQGASKPFRLLEPFDAGYIKFQGREPRTLEELAIARETRRHAARLAEVKAMAKKLTLLDPLLPALAERGLTFSHRNISTLDGGKTLRIETPFFSLEDDGLYAALIGLGFREVERSSYSARSEHEQVTLKHGRALVVKIDVTKKPAAPAA